MTKGEEEGEEVSEEKPVLDYCPPKKRGRSLWVLVLLVFVVIASSCLMLSLLLARFEALDLR